MRSEPDYKHPEKKYPVAWLVYYYKGEIKVKKGYVRIGHTFYPIGENYWQCGIPERYMEVSSKGKVLVRHKEDIPIAKQMIYEHYLGKIDEVSTVTVRALNNIKKMIEGENMIITENNCVQCEDCRNCGRDHQKIGRCDDCGDQTNELWYGEDGKQYCKWCITGHIEKVGIE